MFSHTMDKHTFPPGDKLVAGRVSVIEHIDFDAYMKPKHPSKIIQCSFYKSVSKEQKIVDLFHPNDDFKKYKKDYDFVACSIQSM